MNRYTLRSVLHGATIYAAGDTVASLLLGEFTLVRMLGMILVGATFYAFEIPRYFSWIDRTVKTDISWLRACQRISLALAYFNPLWIARHLAFIQLFSGRFHAIGYKTLKIGTISWAANIPILILGNYIIQMVLPLRWRFFGSALFSACLAVYYAFCEMLFG